MEELLNGYFLQVFVFICINVILALTIYMTLCTGLVSLGNAGFMSFGAYTSAILAMKMDVPMPLSILCGGIVAAVVALIIGIPTIRLRGLYLAIATLGFGEVVRVIALNMKITNGALGLSGILHGERAVRLCQRSGPHRCTRTGLPDDGPAPHVRRALHLCGRDLLFLVPAGTLPRGPRLRCHQGR